MPQAQIFSGRINIMLFLAALLTLSACSGTAPRVEGPVAEPTRPAERELPRRITLPDLEEAYANGQYSLAQRMAEEFTGRPGLDAGQLGRAWRILALSAVENQKPRPALTALDRWRHSLPGAAADPEWREAWYAALTQLPGSEADKLAEAVIRSGSGSEPRPAALIREARLFLLERPLLQGNGQSAIPGLIDLYNAAAPGEKRILENRTWRLLHQAGRSPLARLMAYTTDDNEGRYPYALIRLENARRMFWDVKNRNAARENVNFTRDAAQLADRGLFSRWNEPDFSHFAKLRARNNAIALVLPLTGQYGNLAEKIVRGAETARRGFEANGQTLHIYVIDSDQPDWLLKLSRLPREVRVVGGPMRLEEYSAVKSMGFADGRFFFSFLPRMDEQDEGYLAWRFFPSREDQVRVMLDYAGRLGLTDFAIYAPDQGEYAQGMFDLFYYQAAERDLHVNKAGYYPARQYQLWVKNVSDFLGYSKEAEKKGEPQVPLPFQAMFLPDNWSNSARIISHVFYARDNNILFLGTNLWEHGLAAQQRLATRNFRLAVFPGSWDQQSMTPSGQAVRGSAALSGDDNADFWFSLGYDFALASASLALPPEADADDLNAALAALPPLPWSGAPITWDKNGFARQELFVLTPAENGFVLANQDRIRELLRRTPRDTAARASNAPGEPAPDEPQPGE